MAPAARVHLFSVDLEDLRTMFPGGERYAERVPHNAERYLELLRHHRARCTFFTTGDVARRYPALVRDIVAEGHEVASHSSEHRPLTEHDPASFRADVARSVEDLLRAGAPRIVGFRAPSGSLTRRTRWAYAVLAELGFVYSSSVVAAPNPIHAWPDFGPDLPTLRDGLWELPPSLVDLGVVRVPLAGGTYLRVLPFAVIRRAFRRRLAAGAPVVGYVHPYDIDAEQERFRHPQSGQSRLVSWLMYRNRRGLYARLERLLAEDAHVMRYDDYVARVLAPGAAAPQS